MQDQLSLDGGQFSPGAGRQVAELKASNSHPDEPQGWMADSRRHAADLAVLPLEQLQANPTSRHGLTEADRRVTRGNIWLWLQNPGPAGERLACLNDQSLRQLEQGVRRWNPFDLDPVFALVGVTRVQQSFVQGSLVAEQQQTFGVGVEPANGIDVLREAEFRQRPIW